MDKSLQTLLLFATLIYLTTVGTFQFVCGLILLALVNILEFISIYKRNKKLKSLIDMIEVVDISLKDDSNEVNSTKKKSKNKTAKGE